MSTRGRKSSRKTTQTKGRKPSTKNETIDNTLNLSNLPLSEMVSSIDEVKATPQQTKEIKSNLSSSNNNNINEKYRKKEEEEEILLTNFEVFQLLKEEKKKKFSQFSDNEAPTQENKKNWTGIRQLEYHLENYLAETEQNHTLSSTNAYLDVLSKYSLTKAEKVQMLNLKAKSEVEFLLVVEECEERIDEYGRNQLTQDLANVLQM